MSASRALAFLATLAATSADPATFFYISPLVTSDIHASINTHSISFTVSNPNAVYEQGGNAPQNCSIFWTDDAVPTCYTQCGYSYYARVRPGTYGGAYEYSLNIQEFFIFKNSVLNNVSVPIVEGADGIACSCDEKSTVCEIEYQDGINATFDTTYGVSQPGNVC